MCGDCNQENQRRPLSKQRLCHTGITLDFGESKVHPRLLCM